MKHEEQNDHQSDTQWEERELAGLEFIPTELVERLAEYHIGTIGALLGATRGLLDPIRVGEEYEAAAVKLAENLAGVVPREIVERFREARPPIPPPGALPPEPADEERSWL